MNVRKLINWKLFLILLPASVVANMAVLPYALSLGALRTKELPVPLSVAILVQVIQATIFFAVAIFFGLFLGRKVGLGAPFIESWITGKSWPGRLRVTAEAAIILGVAAGMSIFVLDRFIFSIFVEPITAFQEAGPLWQRFLASFYGGVGEEIGMRLFMMTLIVWVTYKFKRTKDDMPTNAGVWLAITVVFKRTKDDMPTNAGVWLAITVVSVVFGLGHLPMTAVFTEITVIVVLRAIILNGIAGVVFGWLYWRKGLEAAMISHFSADIVLHVILPSII